MVGPVSTDDRGLADETRSGARPEADRAEIGYEEARAELSDVVRRLESGGHTLEESLALWQRGEELADICERWLSGATARLNAVIAAHEEGSAGAPPDEAVGVDRSHQT